MKRVILIGLILCLILVVPVSADTFSALMASGDSWIATNDTYTIRMWNATGSHSFVTNGNATSVRYLVVGGGAGAGSSYAGGAGAGGFLTGTAYPVSGIVAVTVGDGGVATAGTFGNGQNSSFANTTTGNGINAKGGGGGGHYSGQDAQIGGSGGGGVSNGYGSTTGASGIAGQGNAGGNADAATRGGGGGGAGAAGSDYVTGNGGNGLQSDITGTLTYYAGGGGGGDAACAATQTGGLGGGGKGGCNANPPNAGTDGLGGGGGGGQDSVFKEGGSGVVIIQYISPPPVASFTPTGETSGVSPLAVQFNDTSTNIPTSWAWGRNNLTVTTWEQFSTVQNATQTFVTGNWSVNLTATNAAGSNISTQATWVNVSSGATTPIAISSLSRLAIQAGWYVWRNDTSLNTPTAWCWTFGDGTFAATANGSKTYYRRGIFNVSSNVSNSAGFNISYNIIRVV